MRILLESGDSGNARGEASRRFALVERMLANAEALDAIVASGRLSRPLLRSLANDLRDFASEAVRYEEARVLLGEIGQ